MVARKSDSTREFDFNEFWRRLVGDNEDNDLTALEAETADLVGSFEI